MSQEKTEGHLKVPEARVIVVGNTDTSWVDEVFKALGVQSSSKEQEKSRQLREDPFGSAADYSRVNIAQPPYNIEALALCPEKSSMLSACIQAMAQNVVGFGYEVHVKKGIDKAEDDDEIVAEKKRLGEFLENCNPNPEMDFMEIMEQVMIDKHTIGQGAIEVVRNKAGEISSLYHAPSYTIRVMIEKLDEATKTLKPQGCIQIRNGKKIYFKNYGDRRLRNRFSGEYSDEGDVEHIPWELQASEMLLTRKYSSKNTYYGVPLYISALLAISGNRYAEETNNAFFRNSSIGPQMLILRNAHLTEESTKNLQDYWKAKYQGAENAYKLIVVDIESNEIAPEERLTLDEKPAQASVDLKPMMTRDEASYLKYIETNDDRIRACFRIPPILTGQMRDVNRANSETARYLAEEQTFAPERRRLQKLINNTIVKDQGIKYVEVVLNAMQIGDPGEAAKRETDIAKAGGRTIDDLRDLNSKDRFGKWWSALVPAPVGVEFLKQYLLGVLSGQTDILNEEEIPEVEKIESEGSASEENPKVGGALQKVLDYIRMDDRDQVMLAMHDPKSGKSVPISPAEFVGLVHRMRDALVGQLVAMDKEATKEEA